MFNFFKKNENYLIHNISKKSFEKHFAANTINLFVYIIFSLSGFLLYLYNNESQMLIQNLYFLIFPIIIISLLSIIGRWEEIIIISFLIAFALYWYKGFNSFYYSTFIITGAIMSFMIQIAKEWERAIILRFGKFKKVKGPGLFLIIPFIDSVYKKVDIRTRVTDFKAEITLTKDSVTVTVDALCFWLVWDPEKAICEVENYIDAVILSSLTGLREAISMHDLSYLLEHSDKIEEHIRKTVDQKTTEWGITVQHIEITDIQIPEELQDTMSRLAQAEREKKARLQIGEAEIELAKKFVEASEIYKNNKIAFKLRSLSILNEGLKAGNSMIMVPSTIPENLSGEDVFGLQALHEIKKGQKINLKNTKKTANK